MGAKQAVSVRRAILFGSAPCADWSFLKHYLSAGCWTVFCADGGVKSARAAGLMPEYLIGDWDSGGAPESGLPCLSLPPEKDMTDLQAAVAYAMSLGARELLLCGCTGGRLDHTAANLNLLEQIRTEGGRAVIADPENEVQFLDSEGLTLKNEPPLSYLSLLPLDRELTGVCLRGVKYPLENAVLHRGDTRSVSNEFAAAEAEIIVGVGRGLLIRSK